MAGCAVFSLSACLALASAATWADAARGGPNSEVNILVDLAPARAAGSVSLVDYSRVVSGFHRLDWTGDPKLPPKVVCR